MGNTCLNSSQNITIKCNDESFKINNQLNDTVKRLKQKISRQRKIDQSHIMLSYNGRKLQDNQTIYLAGFQNQTDYITLNVKNQQSDGKQISVNIRSLNFTQKIKINPQNTIGQLKQIINVKKDFPVNKQRLICGGVVLQDYQKVSKYGIKDDSTIHLATVLVA